MYQVLQVYTSFSFFDNFLSMSMKVGQSSSRKRRRNVSETNWRFEKVSKESQKKSKSSIIFQGVHRAPQFSQILNRPPRLICMYNMK